MKSMIMAALLGAMINPQVAQAQFSESYNFLKAVRDRDGNKATEIISKPGSVIVDTREAGTGEGALHIVTKARDSTWLAFLLARGAKPDLRDAQGATPLMIAAQLGFIEGAQALIGRGASVDLTNNAGETPLIRAVQVRDAAMVRLLLGAGANPNKTDNVAGLSARDYATRDRRSAAILKIIEETRPAKPKGAVGPTR
ncbi:MAG: ankyrin repeat domain-containing protein [Sphingomonadaceae bacterium]